MTPDLFDSLRLYIPAKQCAEVESLLDADASRDRMLRLLRNLASRVSSLPPIQIGTLKGADGTPHPPSGMAWLHYQSDNENILVIAKGYGKAGVLGRNPDALPEELLLAVRAPRGAVTSRSQGFLSRAEISASDMRLNFWFRPQTIASAFGWRSGVSHHKVRDIGDIGVSP